MAMTKASQFTFLNADQIDALYTVYTSAQIKGFLDSQATELRDYLNDTLTEEIDTGLATKAELAAAVLSGISDDSITNAKMAPDVKIGSLAALKTATKTSATAAINELAIAGAVITYAGATVPTGFLECNGTTVSRTTYANLFTAIGVLYGVGNGTTTFNLPDLRGEFVRGYDNGRGIDSGRVLGSAQAGTYASPVNPGAAVNYSGGQWIISPDANGAFRPRNIAMMYCIKY